MLAKPEYSSPPDEVCCWPGRRGGAAGKGAAAKSHREDVAGRGTVAKKLATPWQRAIGKELLIEGAAVAKMLLAGVPGGRYLIQQRRHVQKAFLQRSNC